MNVTRWNPFRRPGGVFDRIRRSFARPGQHWEGRLEAPTIADWAPAVEISESEHRYLIKLSEARKKAISNC